VEHKASTIFVTVLGKHVYFSPGFTCYTHLFNRSPNAQWSASPLSRRSLSHGSIRNSAFSIRRIWLIHIQHLCITSYTILVTSARLFTSSIDMLPLDPDNLRKHHPSNPLRRLSIFLVSGTFSSCHTLLKRSCRIRCRICFHHVCSYSVFTRRTVFFWLPYYFFDVLLGYSSTCHLFLKSCVYCGCF